MVRLPLRIGDHAGDLFDPDARARRDGDAELAAEAAQRVDPRGPRRHPQRAGAVQRLQRRLDMLVLAGGHHHRIDRRIGNDFQTVGADDGCAGAVGKLFRRAFIEVGNTDAMHRRVRRRQFGAHVTDAPGADDGETNLPALQY